MIFIVDWKEQGKIKEATDLIYKTFTAQSLINVNIEDIKDLNTIGNCGYISFGKDAKEILETDFCRGKKLEDVSKLIVNCISHRSVTVRKIDKVMKKIYSHIKTDVDIYFGHILSNKLSIFKFLLIGT